MSNITALVSYFASLSGLAIKAFKDGNEKNCNKYLLLLSKTLGLVFGHADAHPELASNFHLSGKSLALIEAAPDLVILLIDYTKQLKVITRPIVSILRFAVYSKKNNLKSAFENGGNFVEAVKIILEGLTAEKQPVRKEAGKAVQYMLEVTS
jgi:hypothetical protein